MRQPSEIIDSKKFETKIIKYKAEFPILDSFLTSIMNRAIMKRG